jgi:hypothetical protein
MSATTQAKTKDQLVALRRAHKILADENRALRNDNYVLAQALKQYTYCRHACVDCFCTREARAALHEGKL